MIGDQPLFDLGEIGLNDLKGTPDTVRCIAAGCGRPLRSETSKAARIGPSCAAKIGRAIAAARTRKTRVTAA